MCISAKSKEIFLTGLKESVTPEPNLCSLLKRVAFLFSAHVMKFPITFKAPSHTCEVPVKTALFSVYVWNSLKPAELIYIKIGAG
jgi:hypothetical protein